MHPAIEFVVNGELGELCQTSLLKCSGNECGSTEVAMLQQPYTNNRKEEKNGKIVAGLRLDRSGFTKFSSSTVRMNCMASSKSASYHH